MAISFLVLYEIASVVSLPRNDNRGQSLRDKKCEPFAYFRVIEVTGSEQNE